MTTVVITGSTRGIGAGLAREFAVRGCNVVVAGRNPADAIAVAQQIGAKAIGVGCDVRDPGSLEKVWVEATAAFGRVDHWINNAGVSHQRRPLWELEDAAVDAVIGTNLNGSINGCRVAIPRMIDQGGGYVWLMEGFGSGGQAAAGISAYAASKRGLRGLSDNLVKDTADTPVKVGTISPGIVLTDLLESDYDGQPEAFEKAKKIFNILGDTVDTVTPFIVSGVLAAKRSGASVTWLTKRKAAARFATAWAKPRDLWND